MGEIKITAGRAGNTYPRICLRCNGVGYVATSACTLVPPERCRTCGGSGVVFVQDIILDALKGGGK